MGPIIYIKLALEALIAVPKILSEIRDTFIYYAEIQDEEWLNSRKAKREEIEAQFQIELKRKKPDVKKLYDLHRARYRP